MRKSCRWAGLRNWALALGLIVFGGAVGRADAIMSYETAGSIDSSGVSGPGVISFVPIQQGDGSFNAPSAFSLGDFLVAALPAGQATTYTDTPFHITYLVNSVNGAAPDPNQTPIQVSGVLNGTVTGGNQSNVVATFNAISNPTFLTGNYSNTLSILDQKLPLSVSLVPSTTNGGQTSAQAYLDTQVIKNPIPEPTSIAMFLTTIAGLGLRHRLRNRRAA